MSECPSYISSRSAEVILSDVRPIKLKAEALHSLNVLLDEILYALLVASNSLTTDKLKAALLKILPTSLGKEALLEAEVELKAYWERTGTRVQSSARHGENFDLQWSFEVLRLKCEAYSTMNDSDEDAEAEKRLQHRMEAAGSSTPPSPVLLAPAALYLTAILEAICEHVLSNVSRVAARDSSCTVATIQDLFIALGEDDAIFGMFKSMKVYQHIEALSHRPRRSKSFSKSTDKAILPRTSTSSPLGGETTATPVPRTSTESQKSTIVGSNESRRPSVEKVKGVKIFHTRTLSDKHEPATAGLARSQSEMGISRDIDFEEDEELQQEFDELMRSGATMKVSLTPDRLRTMEVYKQERIERERLSRRAGQAVDKGGQDGGAASTTALRRGGPANGRLRHVDSIVEDEEESSSSNSANLPPFQSNAAVRMRNTSLTAPNSMGKRPSDQRLRSISISNVPHPRHEDGIVRKVSSVKHNLGRVGSQNAAPPISSGVPKKARKIQQNRESMDLDEVMAGSDDGEDDLILKTPTNDSSPRKPHISKGAQDLISFLDAGPPDEPAYNPSINGSVISFESSKTRSGRLQRMMSRLALGGSKESLNGSIPETPRTLTRKNSKMTVPTSPPPSFKTGSLSSKRSIPSVVTVNSYPNVIIATPPPRPPLFTTSPPPSVSHSSSTQTLSDDVSTSLTRRTTRKAVPSLDDTAISPSSSVAHDFEVNGRHEDDNKNHASVSQTPVLNGHLVRLDALDTTPRSRSANITSPTSTLDGRSVHAHSKAESGYASRSASRSPITPSERLPPSAPSAPTISVSDAEDLRRLLNVATSADECRLLVDMFFIKNAVPIKDVPADPVSSSTAKPSLEDALTRTNEGNDEIEIERGEQHQSQSSPQSSLSMGSSSSNSSHSLHSLSSSNHHNSQSALLSPVSPTNPIYRRLSVTVPRFSVDYHILNLYRIYQSGLGLDSSG